MGKLLLLPIALALSSCALGDAAFKVSSEPDLAQDGTQVSVFGVFKGGQMSSEYWDFIGPDLSVALGAGQKLCETGVGDHLRSDDPPLYAKIDEDTKDAGITNEVLDKLAARAQGGMILAVSVFGQPPPERPSQGLPPPGSGMNGRSGRGMRGMGGMAQQHHTQTEEGAFEVTVLLYSVRKHDLAGKIELRYTGQSVEDAIKKLADKLKTSFPNLTCTGWKWSAA